MEVVFLTDFQRIYTQLFCLSWYLVFRALITDLYETFYFFNHESLVDKFHANRLDNHVFNLIHSYLTERIQKSLTGNASSPSKNIVNGVTQGSIHQDPHFVKFCGKFRLHLERSRTCFKMLAIKALNTLRKKCVYFYKRFSDFRLAKPE